MFMFSIGSDNGLTASGRQATVLTNDGKLTDAYMHHPAPMSQIYLNSIEHNSITYLYQCSFEAQATETSR